MHRSTRYVAITTALAMLSSCAYLIHPEQRGNKGGAIDVVPLVVDILLFIPGLIPGVIAIAVDFASGAIYTGGGGKRADLGPTEVGREGELAIRARDLPRNAVVELRLVDSQGHVLDRDHTDGRDGKRRERLSVDLGRAAEALPETGAQQLALQLQVDAYPVVEYPLVMR